MQGIYTWSRQPAAHHKQQPYESFGFELLDTDPLGWTITLLIREQMNETDPARTLNESRRMICRDESVEDFQYLCVKITVSEYCVVMSDGYSAADVCFTAS